MGLPGWQMQRKLKPEAWFSTSPKMATEFLCVRVANSGLSLRYRRKNERRRGRSTRPKRVSVTIWLTKKKWQRVSSPSAIQGCFEHVEKEESVLRMPQMPTSAQQWVTKKAHGGFLVRPQGVAQHAPAKERDAPSPPSSEALCWTGSRNPRKAFGQGRRTTGPKDRQDSATNQWLFSLLKDLKACRQTLCSKEGNRSANTG